MVSVGNGEQLQTLYLKLLQMSIRCRTDSKVKYIVFEGENLVTSIFPLASIFTEAYIFKVV